MIRNLLLVALGALVVTPAHADAPHNGALVNVKARYVFAPVGFDDNDEAVMVVDGFLPSGCYRLTRPNVVIDQVAKTIVVTPQARYFNIPCVEALVPYHFDVNLGVLSIGDYKVTVINANAVPLPERLAVTEASNAGPDDFLYAPIDEVTVNENHDSGKLTATLRGRFTLDCMTFGDVRVIDNGKSVNILPIMKVDHEGCQAVETPFVQTVDLPTSIAAGRHLLHVRSLNGAAVNYLFYRSAP
jgi:hypothetical protein